MDVRNNLLKVTCTIIFCFMLVSVAAAEEESAPAINILFIGNSYTYVNDMPVVITKMARSGKPRLVIRTVDMSNGGYTLEKHVNEGRAFKIIRDMDFDFVVLQEQSLRPILDKKKMHDAIRRLDSAIKQSESQTVLYMTWAREDKPKMTEPIAAAYKEIGNEIGAKVACVGLAWQKALKERPELSLYDSDKSHANRKGTYLTACIFYATLTGKNPAGLSTGELKGITDEEAAFLQKIAWETFKGQLPEKKSE